MWVLVWVIVWYFWGLIDCHCFDVIDIDLMLMVRSEYIFDYWGGSCWSMRWGWIYCFNLVNNYFNFDDN